MLYPEIYRLSLRAQVGVRQSNDLAHGKSEGGMYEPIKKMTKDSVLDSATESSCHHNFFVYLAKHL